MKQSEKANRRKKSSLHREIRVKKKGQRKNQDRKRKRNRQVKGKKGTKENGLSPSVLFA